MEKSYQKHIMVPDLQSKPGVPLNNLIWIGEYLAELEPDVVVNIGDFEDCHSLSHWDKGKLCFEGRKVAEDFACTELACDLIYGTAARANPEWYDSSRIIITLGNHEDRRNTAIQSDPKLEGLIPAVAPCYYEYHDDVVPFGDTITIDGIAYSHFFAEPNTGKPISGLITTQLRKLGASFTAGHKPGFDYAEDVTPLGAKRHALVAGAAYLHFEDYKRMTGNIGHWRGVVVKNEVREGAYDLMKISLDYLCRRYEGMTLMEFAKRPDLWVGYGDMDNDAMKWALKA